MTNPLIKALEPLTSRVRTDVTAVKRDGQQSWTREPLTPERVAKHLNGGPARGVCPIKAGESVTLVALLDLDSHKGDADWSQMAEAADKVTAALQRRNLVVIPWRSSGGRGMHLYMLWDTPQDAYSVRMLLVEALAEAGFTNGAGGVPKGQIEVFPKQNSVATDGFGNQFILPLAGHSVPLDPLDFSPLDKDPAMVSWPTSPPVLVRERQSRSVTVYSSPIDAHMAARALASIPNTFDYDGWFRALCSAKEAGVDEETARSWSAQNSAHDDDEFKKKWASIEVGKEEGASADLLYRMAQQQGFSEHIAEDFEVVELPPDTPGMPMFEREKSGAIKPTVRNTVAAVRVDSLCGMRVAYDAFRDEITVARPTTNQWAPMSDADAVRIRMALESRGFKSAPKELVRDAVVLVAAENTYDSAQLWLGALKHDGQSRVATFLRDYMGCEDTPYTRAVSRYMWSALAGRIIEPGVKADMVPIYEGAQGLRKSSAIEALSPAPDFFLELDLEAKEEDTVRKMRGALVAEIAELSGLHTRALEWIKKFVVRKHEKWVPKYKEFPTTFARRMLFIGTTNRTDILADETGNRRWLPLHITQADVESIVRDRDQLWAEGALLFAEGGVCWQEAERLAPVEHGAYTIGDVWDDAVRRWLDGSSDFDGPRVSRWETKFTTAEVAVGALGMSHEKQDRLTANRISAILRGLGFEQKTARSGVGTQKKWVNMGRYWASVSQGDADVTLDTSHKNVSDFNDLA